jgi:hypothetical protein
MLKKCYELRSAFTDLAMWEYSSSRMSYAMRRLSSLSCWLLRPRWVGILLVIEWGVYFGFLYPWLMNWRATSTERQMVYGP